MSLSQKTVIIVSDDFLIIKSIKNN